MIHFTLTGKQVKDFFGMIGVFRSECRLHIEPDKIRVALVDCANIAMINTEVNIHTGAKADTKFGLQIGNILSFAKIAKDTDPIEFKIIEKKDSLCMQMSCLTHSARIKSEDDTIIRKDPNGPTIEYSHTFPCSGERIAEFFKMYPKADGKFRIILKDGKVSFKTHEEFNYEYETVVCNAPKGNAKSLFSSDYLKPVFGRMKKSMITISMRDDHPVKLVTVENDVVVEVIMAPRIEAD